MKKHSGLAEMGSAAAKRIAFVVVCVLIAEWAFPLLFGRRPWVFSVPIIAILVFGFLSHRALHERAPELGLRLGNFLYAARLLGPPMLIAVIALIAIGYRNGSLGMPRPSADWHRLRTLLWLLWWALLQQYALQAIINRQAQIIWGKGARSISIVALIFASLHLPNLPLMFATFAGGLVWASVYQRAPNLIALALSHSIMTIALIWALPASILHGLRVGAGYY